MDDQPELTAQSPEPEGALTKAEHDAKLGLQNAAQDMGQAQARFMQLNPNVNILEVIASMKLIGAQLDALCEILMSAGVLSKMAFWDQAAENVSGITKDIQTAIGQVSLIARPDGPLPKIPKSN